MAEWQNVKVGDFLFEREGKYQPEAEMPHSSTELLDMLHQSFAKGDDLLVELRKELG